MKMYPESVVRKYILKMYPETVVQSGNALYHQGKPPQKISVNNFVLIYYEWLELTGSLNSLNYAEMICCL